MNMSGERFVELQEVEDRGEAGRRFRAEEPLGGVERGVPVFTEVNGYTTFFAKHTWQGGNVIIQFFLPPERRETDEHFVASSQRPYWLEAFPRALSDVAQEYFQATLPRLQVKWTEELGSWWFKAQGYGHLLDPEAFLTGFYDQLDAALEASQQRPN